MPTGKVKWYDGDKGFGFLTRDDGGEVFVHSTSLPEGTTALRTGQRVEFGVADGRKGAQALQVKLLDSQHSVVEARRKKPEEMVVITEDLIKLLEGLSSGYRKGRRPDRREAAKVASVLRVVADELDT
ncbi:cold-shock protein [Nocardiopsis salina]|uniref:cold-shock protein n=1 Tax=Nocardiopsis salina TaxID=245836 RepID=UPI00034A02D0|nr:cold-shock protein [Nocardiopsis salina]